MVNRCVVKYGDGGSENVLDLAKNKMMEMKFVDIIMLLTVEDNLGFS